MFERFFRKKVGRNEPKKLAVSIWERAAYPDFIDFSEVVRGLTEANLHGVQIDMRRHELVYPAEHREKIDRLLRCLEDGDPNI